MLVLSRGHAVRTLEGQDVTEENITGGADDASQHGVLLGELHLLRDGPARGEDGKLRVTFPLGTAKMPSSAAEDIGKAAYGIFKAGDRFIGKRVGIAGGHVSGAEFAAGFTKELGEPVEYNEVSPAAYRGFGFPGAEDIGNRFQYKRDFEDAYRGARDLDLTRELNPEVQIFEQWLAAAISKVPVA